MKAAFPQFICLRNPDHLLINQYLPGIHIPVAMVMAEKPLPEPGIPENLFQVSSLNIRPVPCTAQQNLRAGRAAVSHNEIHGIAICRQIPAPLLHLLL